jgi:hypothetical protein
MEEQTDFNELLTYLDIQFLFFLKEPYRYIGQVAEGLNKL